MLIYHESTWMDKSLEVDKSLVFIDIVDINEKWIVLIHHNLCSAVIAVYSHNKKTYDYLFGFAWSLFHCIYMTVYVYLLQIEREREPICVYHR